MIGYLKAHWRGEHSLARSAWINGLLPMILILAVIAVAERTIPSTRIETSAVRGLITLALVAAIGVWQAVGIWRSATAATRATGKALWPSIAKGLVLAAALAAIARPVATARDYAAIIVAVNSPRFADYRIDRRGESELVLVGAINDASVDEVTRALNHPSFDLRIKSRGGLVESAIRLARFVRDRRTPVVAEEECLSACLLVLAASPKAAMLPGTRITFHRIEPIAELSSTRLRQQHERYVETTTGYYREFGIPEWAIGAMDREGAWTPTIRQLIEMGVIDLIFEPASQQFVPAKAYCAAHKEECAR